MSTRWIAFLALLSTCGVYNAAVAAAFTDVTAEVGLDTPGFRLSVADVDGDGYPDIYLHRYQDDMAGDVLNKQFLFMNRPCPANPDPYCRVFVDVTASSGIRANRQGDGTGRHQDGAIFADVDNDGDLDLFSMVYVHRNYTLDKGRNDLLLNDGTGHFTLAPNSTFHTEPVWNTAAAVFVDYDNDGKVDLYIGNWYNPDSTLTKEQLYHGNGDGSFVNVTDASGVGSKTDCIYGIAAWDWNRGGLTNLFAPPYAWTVLDVIPLQWRNNGNGTFTRIEHATQYDLYRGTLSSVASFGSMPADYDNDGNVDFLEVLTHGKGDAGTCSQGSLHTTVVTNLGPPDYKYRWDCARVKNRGLEDTDLTHHGDHYGSWFDYDNDGLYDFALTEGGYTQPSGGYNNRLYLFKQAADHTFSPVTKSTGLDAINTLPGNPNPHNVIPLDYDLDGDMDLLVGFADDVTKIQLWRNDVGTQKHWITVIPKGAGVAGHANRAGIGARVEVTAGGTTWTREVYAGNGHMGPQQPLALSFGLAVNTVVDRVRVRWPNPGLTWTELTNVAVDRFLTIDEPCARPSDASGLMVARSGADVLLTWTDPSAAGVSWNVHRGPVPNPASWGSPLAGVTAAHYTDTGAFATPASYFYLVGAKNECGETRPW